MKDNKAIAKFLGISKKRLEFVVEETEKYKFVKDLESITTIEEAWEQYFSSQPLSGPEMAAYAKLLKLLSEKIGSVTTKKQARKLLDEADTDVEQDVIIMKIYELFKK